MSVSRDGFKTKAIENVVLRVGQTRTLDASLEAGATTEVVDVHAENVPTDRSSAEAATVIGAEQIENLPNNGRDSVAPSPVLTPIVTQSARFPVVLSVVSAMLPTV